MAAQPLMRSLSTRTVKKLEKPRPLKVSVSQSKIPNEPSLHVLLQDLMSLVESASQSLLDKNYDDTLTSNIAVMHSKLKDHGQQLETIFKDQLDRAFVIFRNGCQDDQLLCTTRLHLLELVELRANQWSTCDNTQIYYSAKMAATEIEPLTTMPDVNTTSSMSIPAPSPPLPPILSPGEVLKTSGKFTKPTKIPGKNYCKDEVVIRNSDSGKVMGIKGRRVHMIEELSETIISFQRVNPGAKERLVQITGLNEDKIVHAKQLMEETIRRNASPVREGCERECMGGSSSSLNSSASDESSRLTQPGSRRSALLHSFSTNDASLGEYKYTITLGHDTVKITGSNHETVRNARLVLEEYYNTWLQKNCVGDCYGLDEDVFIDPIQDMAMLQLDSVDSGNGNGPFTSSGDSDDITCISTVPTPVTSLEHGLAYQTIYPVAQPERRAVLGRSNSIPLAVSVPSQNQVVSRKYSRDFLIQCALSHHSRATPFNWEQIILDCPAIAKKVSSPFDPRAFLKQSSGPSTSFVGADQPRLSLIEPDSE